MNVNEPPNTTDIRQLESRFSNRDYRWVQRIIDKFLIQTGPLIPGYHHGHVSSYLRDLCIYRTEYHMSAGHYAQPSGSAYGRVSQCSS